MAKKSYTPSTEADDKRFEACYEASEYDTKTDYIESLVRADARERGLFDVADAEDALDGEAEEAPVWESYNPDADGVELTADEALEIAKRRENARIDPAHVIDVKQNRDAEQVFAAMTRHRHERPSREDVERLCKEFGFRSDYHLRSRQGDRDIPGGVIELLGGAGKRDEEVETDRSAANVEEIVKAAVGGVFEPVYHRDAERLKERLKDVEEDALDAEVVPAKPHLDVVSYALEDLRRHDPLTAGAHELAEVESARALVDWHCENHPTDDYPVDFRDQVGEVLAEIGDE